MSDYIEIPLDVLEDVLSFFEGVKRKALEAEEKGEAEFSFFVFTMAHYRALISWLEYIAVTIREQTEGRSGAFDPFL